MAPAPAAAAAGSGRAALVAAASLGAVGGAFCTWQLLTLHRRRACSPSSSSSGKGLANVDGGRQAAAAAEGGAAGRGEEEARKAPRPQTSKKQPPQQQESCGAKGEKAATRAPAAAKAYRREVICEDALKWLARPGAVPKGAFVFTSLPDVTEVVDFAPTLDAWENWFCGAVGAVLKALPAGAVAVFYQTDIRQPGVGQVSKAHMVLRAAAELDDVALWWHKVVHFGNIDQPACTSVQFTHLICFGKSASSSDQPRNGPELAPQDPGGSIPDVVACGRKPSGLRKSARCMGTGVVHTVLKWAIRSLPGVEVIVDPFCGAGTALAIGNALGLRAVGVDLSVRRVKQAEKLDGDELLAGQPRASEREAEEDEAAA